MLTRLHLPENTNRSCITQSQLITKPGISWVRVNQNLALLKLPAKRQAEILKFGKDRIITERNLRRQTRHS